MDLYSFKDTCSKSGPMVVDPPWVEVQDPRGACELPEPSCGEPASLREFHAGARGPQRTVGWVVGGGWGCLKMAMENEKTSGIVGYILYC